MKSPAANSPTSQSWNAPAKSSGPLLNPAFADANCRASDFVRSGSISTRGDDPPRCNRARVRPVRRPRLARCPIYRTSRTEVWVSTSNSRIDSMSSPKNSDAEGQLRLPGIEIHDAAAHRELAASGDLRDALVTGGCQLFQQRFHRIVRHARSRERRISERRASARLDRDWRAWRQSPAARLAFSMSAKQGQPFRRDFGIGQNVFNGREFSFRQKQRAGQPVHKTLVKQFLRTHARAEDPEVFSQLRAIVAMRNAWAEPMTCEKSDRIGSLLNIPEFPRDRFSPRDNC